jgi:hypothetical protein
MILLVTILAFNINNCINFQLQNINSTKTNAVTLDRISSEILDYENQTNIIVSKVIFYCDKNINLDFWGEEMFASKYPVYYVNWSRVYALNIYLNRKLIEQNPDENSPIYNFFINKDWNEFNEEQIIIDGDTVNICMF